MSTFVPDPESTIDYKIGYRHGALGRDMTPGQNENYALGYAQGYAGCKAEETK